MKNLEEELFNVKWTKTYGEETDFKKGYKESLKFCMRKIEKGWTVEDFKADMLETLDLYSKCYGSYKDGIIKGLEFNIKNMEVATNE